MTALSFCAQEVSYRSNSPKMAKRQSSEQRCSLFWQQRNNSNEGNLVEGLIFVLREGSATGKLMCKMKRVHPPGNINMPSKILDNLLFRFLDIFHVYTTCWGGFLCLFLAIKGSKIRKSEWPIYLSEGQWTASKIHYKSIFSGIMNILNISI